MSKSGLVSLEMSTEEAKEQGPTVALGGKRDKGPKYPYWSTVRFDTQAVEKLDLDDLKVGDKVSIVAEGYVCSTSENARKDGEPSCSVEIQMTSMKVGEATGAKGQKARDEHYKKLM